MKFSSINLTPSWCRWDPQNPPPFTIWLNILYACAGGFTAANLYYSHPILDVMMRDFGTTQAGVANIPTLALAGDCTGILFILPLADFYPRRRFTLIMLSLSMAFWLGLCITNSLPIFQALTFLSALFTGIPQIMLPLVSELSNDFNRATNISIVAMGPTMAILLARILAGIAAYYTSWRVIYWIALGLQASILLSLYLFMPDYPATNTHVTTRQLPKHYPGILWSIVTLYYKYPVLVQAGLMSFCLFFTVSSFWTTLTFLLSAAPYNYPTFSIGLFGLIGAATMVLGPIFGKYIVQPLNSPLISAMIGQAVNLIAIAIGTFVGKHHVAGPVIQALLLDAGLMIVQIANRVAIHECEPKGRNRVNTAFIILLYAGMLTGTKVGNVVYEDYGGWYASGGVSLGIIILAFTVCLVRGPNEKGWFGWSGGWARKSANKNVSDVEGGTSDSDTENSIKDEEKRSEKVELEKGTGSVQVTRSDTIDETRRNNEK